MQLNCLLECLLEKLIDVLARRSRCLEKLVSFLFGVGDGLSCFHLPCFVVGFVPKQKYHCLLQIKPIAFHSILPSTDILERLLIPHIENK